MKHKYSGRRSLLWGASAAALLLPSGGCVPVDQQQWAEFFRDLLLNILAAFLL